jgi:hypothetical protein
MPENPSPANFVRSMITIRGKRFRTSAGEEKKDGCWWAG